MIDRNLPGSDIVEAGLDDLRRREETQAALLVSIGAPRLRELGFDIVHPFPEPEHRLYCQLTERFGDAAHSRYNALIRRLVSFERACACVR